MTNREFLTAISTSELSTEIVEYAQKELAKMDAANEKRRNTPSKKAEGNLVLLDKVLTEFLTAEAKSASEIGAFLGVSTPKATAVMKLATPDQVVVTDMKGAKGKCKGYAIAPVDAE